MPVTIGEYADFLNAVAPADPHVLYHETMKEVIRIGEPGDYHYEIVAGAENLPITFVTWLDAARYCNWKEHGSPSREEVRPETTETGSYTLNDTMTEFVMKNEGAHYVLPTREDDGFDDPTLASNALGFCVIETVQGNQFNAPNLLQASYPDSTEGNITTFDEVVGIGAALALIGGGYAYYRCRGGAEEMANGRTTARITDADRRANDHSEDQSRETSSREVGGYESYMCDDVTGGATNTDLFITDTSSTSRIDQRSFLKKIADSLRNRDNIYSVYSDADQIDYVPDKDPIPSQRTCWQNLIWRMTQPYYPYKDAGDFKNRNPGYLAKQIEKYKAMIATHELKINENGRTIAEHEERFTNHKQAQLEKIAGKQEAGKVRLAQFKKDQERLELVRKLIVKIAELERSCFAVPPVDSAVQQRQAVAADATAPRADEVPLTPFQMLREATQYLLVAKLLRIEKAARESDHVNEEEFAEGQIKTHYDEVCKADAELMERLTILANKKELLWKRLAEMENDFIDVSEVAIKVQFIEDKLPDIQASIVNYGAVAHDRFNAVKRIFEGDERSNASREATDRKSIGGATSVSAEKDKKARSSFGGLFESSEEKKAKKAAKMKQAAVKDLQIETACRELGERIQKQFDDTVDPLTDRVENYFTQSYKMLHLAERNALLGRNLMSLLEADQGKMLWDASSLRPYLVDALRDARARVNKVTQFFAEGKIALVGTWQKQEDPGALNPIYHYHRGGWQMLCKEQDVEAAVKALTERNKQIKQDRLDTLARKIVDAKTIAGLLDTAKERADEFLDAAAASFNAKRAAFLQAMEELLQHPILQPAQSSSGQASAGGGVASRK